MPSHETGDDALRALVIEHFPQARLTYEIAHKLHKHLPLTSAQQVYRALKEVKVAGHTLGAASIEPFATAELLPVKDDKDLVAKIAGLIGIAIQQGRLGGAGGAAGRLLAEVERAPGSHSHSTPTFHFVGPSIFGFTRAKGA